ncbi:MAG: hypothetical protein ACJ76J_02155, partial [Thermoanaerobaculia bacterium]
ARVCGAARRFRGGRFRPDEPLRASDTEIQRQVELARLPWDRWRLAGILKTSGRRPGLLAGAASPR